MLMSTPLSRRQFLKGVGALSCGGALTAAGAVEGAAPSNRIPLTVDAHVHVWTKDPRFPWAPETTNPPETEATAEMLLELMRASNVQRTVIIQVIHYRWDNRYVASVLKRYPRQFRGVARVNPEDPAAPDHLSRLTVDDGFHGVRLSPAGTAAGDWIRGPLMPPLWRRCRDLNVPMTLLAPVSRLPDLAKLIDSFPDLTVVIDHMADSPINEPAQLDHLLALRRFPKVFVKISHTWSLSAQPYPYADTHAQVHRLYDAFGPQRLIAGTDWPLVEKYCTYAQAIELARSRIAFLNDEDRRWICGRTAELVWAFA
jgi:predicted TIM-barrel fold metal-dependent hydrolase